MSSSIPKAVRQLLLPGKLFKAIEVKSALNYALFSSKYELHKLD